MRLHRILSVVGNSHVSTTLDCNHALVTGIIMSYLTHFASSLRYPAPLNITTEVFPNRSVLVSWKNPVRSMATVSRVTFSPKTADYTIVKEVPAHLKSVIIQNLMQNVDYNVTLQNGNQNGVFGGKSEPRSFYLESPVHPAAANTTPVSWLLNPYEDEPQSHTDEIIVVSLIIITWIAIVFWFFTKWAKIRVIEPRYFDYHFLMKYDKAFALRNQVVSAAISCSNGPRKSIIPSAAARFSISAASTRNLDFPFLTSPARERPFFLGIRQTLHRHSHDVRIELTEASSNHDNGIQSPVSV